MPLVRDLRQVVDLFDPFRGATDLRGGRVVSETGRPLHLRDSRHASTRFSIHQQTWHHVPKPKFLFWVRFFGNFPTTDQSTDYVRGISFLVKSVDKPSITPKTETLPQYNKKRIVHTGVDYDPVSIKFHDDANDDTMAFWIDYFRHYFGSSRRRKSHTDFGYDATMAEFNGGQDEGWGFAPADGPSSSFANFYLSHVEIYTFFGGRVSQTDLINPKVVKFQHDNQDYAESSAVSEITMSLDYEGILYQKLSEDLATLQQPTISDLLLDLGDYYQLPEILGNKGFFARLPSRILQDATTALIRGNIPDARGILKGILGETIPLRGDIQDDIKDGVFGNVAQFGISSVLNGLGAYSFGDQKRDPRLFSRTDDISNEELSGYRAANPGSRTGGTKNALASQGASTKSTGLFSSITNGIQSIGSGIADAGRTVISGVTDSVSDAFGSALAFAGGDTGSGIGDYATTTDQGTALCDAGVQALNAVSSGSTSYATNDHSNDRISPEWHEARVSLRSQLFNNYGTNLTRADAAIDPRLQALYNIQTDKANRNA